MKNARDVIIRPIITEKTMKLTNDENKVTFEVKKGTNKTEVKQAIEEIFKVDVVKVNIMNVRPKNKKMGKYEGLTNHVRKAIVKIADGQEINIFN